MEHGKTNNKTWLFKRNCQLSFDNKITKFDSRAIHCNLCKFLIIVFASYIHNIILLEHLLCCSFNSYINLSNTCENNVTQVWDLEKIWVPIGFEPMTFRTPGGPSIHWAIRTHGEQGHLTKSLHEMRLLPLAGSSSEYVVNSDKWVMVKFVAR